MIHPCEHLWREVGSTGLAPHKRAFVDMCGRACLGCALDLTAHEIGSLCIHHWSECRRVIERIAQHILAREIDDARNEVVEQSLVHVNSLHTTAGLTGIEKRAINKIFDRIANSRIGADKGRVLAAKFEPKSDEPTDGGLLHGRTARNGAGETHHVHMAPGNEVGGLFVAQHQIVKQPFRQLCFEKRSFKALTS